MANTSLYKNLGYTDLGKSGKLKMESGQFFKAVSRAL
jgi:hypothetical protein